MDELNIDEFLSIDDENNELDKKKKNEKTVIINYNDGLVERIDKKCITSCGKELLND